MITVKRGTEVEEQVDGIMMAARQFVKWTLHLHQAVTSLGSLRSDGAVAAEPYLRSSVSWFRLDRSGYYKRLLILLSFKCIKV